MTGYKKYLLILWLFAPMVCHAQTQFGSGTAGPNQSAYFGNLAKDNGSDYITGILLNGSTLQTTRDVVGLSNTSIWAPDTASPTSPFMFNYDGLVGFGLGASNIATTTAVTAMGAYSDGVVALTTSGAGQTVSAVDMVGYVSNVPAFGGPGTMSATRKSGFWANNQGNSHIATSFGFRADAQSGSTVNNWGFFSTSTNNDQMGNLTFTTAKTQTKCAAVGTSANPSVVSCAAAPAGVFSCAASAETVCTVNTSAMITANSTVIVTQDSSTTLGTLLGVTCNVTLNAPEVTAKVAATSFSITIVAPAANPACYDFWIIN